MIKSKKGVIDQLAPVVIALVSLGIVLVVAFLVLAEVQDADQVHEDPNASNSTAEVIDAMSDIPGWLPIVVITIIGALLIGLVSVFRRR